MYAGTIAFHRTQRHQTRWLAVAVCSACVHILLIVLLRPPQTSYVPPEPRQVPLVMEFAFPPEDQTSKLEEVPKDKPEATSVPAETVPLDAARTEVLTPEALKENEEKRQTPPAKVDIPEFEDAKDPAKRGPSTMAYDLANGQEKAPDKVQFLGDKNTEAADMAKKDKPIGAAAMEGESTIVTAAGGRRGEDETKVDHPQDPLTGSVLTEGSPEAGKPKKPLDGQRDDDKREDLAGTTPPKAPHSEKDPALSPIQPAGKPFEPTTAPQEVGKAEPNKPLPGERRDGSDGRPDGITEAGGGEEPLPKRGEEHVTTGPQGGAEKKMPDPVPIMTREDERLSANDTRERKVPSPEDSGRPDVPKDPERGRVEDILKGLTRSAPNNDLKDPGIAARKGQIGVEGNGTARSGEHRAVSDVLTKQDVTVAANTGTVAFAKAASPEAAYLKEYFARVNTAWKRNIIASGRFRFEVGSVGMKITLGKDGKLVEIVESSRAGDVSDSSVTECKRALEQAAPHDPFPSALSGKDTITVTIGFIY